ncbi:MAG: type VI secretion system baseplate subunit TssE [Planctomycetes bacterium]|nr:type VI secretion system baseplate subunit TssE [Planctomycetota bacterium]MBL7142746.1 type VI secretion system baseplate subunit TssE [Phycisphaerae bacterium]
MAELAPMDRLQPCLLDRLTDDEPEVSKEGRDQRVVSIRRYKRAVLRDLEMILNSKSHPFHDNIYEFRHAAQSVLNYGIPDLCGATISAISPAEYEAQVKQAFLCFEPRITRNQLSVRIVTPLDSENIRTLTFEIEGELWAQPLPDHLFVKTEVDVETGHHKLKGEVSG